MTRTIIATSAAVTLLAIFLFPAHSARAQYNMGAIYNRIQILDREIATLQQTIERNQELLAKINAFSALARPWFEREERLDKALDEAWNAGDQQRWDDLESKKFSLEALDTTTLPGWDNTPVMTLHDLHAKTEQAAEITPDLTREIEAAKAYLGAKQTERDQYDAQYQKFTQNNEVRLQGLKSKLKFYRADLERAEEIMNPDIWCLFGGETCVHKDVALVIIAQDFMTSGKGVDSKAMADAIRATQILSARLREYLARDVLPGLKSKIEQTEREIAALKSGGELTGCWMLVQDHKAARFRVEKDGQGRYTCTVLSNNIASHPEGAVLFRVTATPGRPGVYTGTEYSTDENGNPRQIPLTITLHQDALSYRSDATLSMVRCY